jgi:hypothetical protein
MACSRVKFTITLCCWRWAAACTYMYLLYLCAYHDDFRSLKSLLHILWSSNQWDLLPFVSIVWILRVMACPSSSAFSPVRDRWTKLNSTAIDCLFRLWPHNAQLWGYFAEQVQPNFLYGYKSILRWLWRLLSSVMWRPVVCQMADKHILIMGV